MFNLIADCGKFIDIYSRLLIGKPAKAPIAVYLELTKKCNYKCVFCDLWKLDQKNELTLDELVIFLEDCKKSGVKLLHVEGGEATLLPYFPKFVAEVSKKKINLSLTTNGSTLNPRYAGMLIESGLKTIAISLDSHIDTIHDEQRGVKGAFEKTISNIKNIKKNHPQVKLWINHIVHRKNFKQMNKFVDFCNSLNIETIYLLPIHDLYPINYFSKINHDLLFKSKDEIKELRDEMSKITQYMKMKNISTLSDIFYKYVADSFQQTLPSGYCDEGKLVCEIDSQGDLFLCLPKKEQIGNIRSDTLLNIWNSSKAKESRINIAGCNYCWYNCHIEPTVRFLPGYFLLNPLKMFRDYKMHLGS